MSRLLRYSTSWSKPLGPLEWDVLSYIHSNKFMTAKLYRRKFYPLQSDRTAALHLRSFEKRGWLLKTRKYFKDDTYFYLSRKSLRELSNLSRILISPRMRSPYVNPFEREHDKRVLEMRIQIEEAAGLKEILWLSDYEMRCGLRMDWKKALVEGRSQNLSGMIFPRAYHRTPDGYFEGSIDGKTHSFVLEYIHAPYNQSKITDMVLNLTRDFPDAYRLIVCREKKDTLKMITKLEPHLKNDLSYSSLWGFSFFEKVIHTPFVQVPWVNMEGDYLSFVKDPILKTSIATRG